MSLTTGFAMTRSPLVHQDHSSNTQCMFFFLFFLFLNGFKASPGPSIASGILHLRWVGGLVCSEAAHVPCLWDKKTKKVLFFFVFFLKVQSTQNTVKVQNTRKNLVRLHTYARMPSLSHMHIKSVWRTDCRLVNRVTNKYNSVNSGMCCINTRGSMAHTFLRLSSPVRHMAAVWWQLSDLYLICVRRLPTWRLSCHISTVWRL